jgi:hypothetical protein
MTTPPPLRAPKYLVLDTNVHLRLLVLEYASKRRLDSTSVAKSIGTSLIIAPLQKDEIRRNLLTVFNDHMARWRDAVVKIKSGIDEVVAHLRTADNLQLLSADQRTVLQQLLANKTHTDKIEPLKAEYSKFEEFVEKALCFIETNTPDSLLDDDKVIAAAKTRGEVSNPPWSEKKQYWLGDCVIWEAVLALLRKGGEPVWFASADSDFRHKSSDSDLHPFLAREAAKAGGGLRFFAEHTDHVHKHAKPFTVLQAICDLLPPEGAARMNRTLDLLSDISPHLTYRDFETVFQCLPFRDREIIKLRTGLGDGYIYLQREVGEIFDLSQPRVSQIEAAARKPFEDAAESNLQ